MVLLKSAGAQEKTLYFLDAHPMCNEINPAIFFNRSVIILNPAFSFSVANSSLTVNSMFNRGIGPQDSLLFWDFENMEKKLKKVNSFHSEAKLNLIFAGKKLRNGYYSSFSFAKKNSNYFSFPRSFIDLRFGNADLTLNKPRTIDLNDYSFNAQIYNEYSFGLSKEISDRFSAGVHLKLLQGKVAAKTSRFNASIETNDDFSQAVLKTDIKIMLSAPVLSNNAPDDKLSVDISELSGQISWPYFTLRNLGAAIDLGFRYEYNSMLNISGSLNDLGFIRWGENPQQIFSKGEYMFDGLYFSTQNIDEFDARNYFKSYTDTLKSVFSPRMNDYNFNTGITAKSYLAASWKRNHKLSFTALCKSSFFSDSFMFEVTTGAVYKPFRRLALAGTWSYSNFSLYNFGIGAVYEAKKFQVYASTDNINAIDILNSKGFNMTFGVSWLVFQDLNLESTPRSVLIFY